jgi:TolA-binding protein
MEASQDTSRYAEAEACFESLLRRYPRDGRCTRALFLAAQMDVERGRYEKAIDRYNRVLRDYPDPEICDKAQFMIGYTYAEHLAQYDVAQDAFAAVIDSYPGSDLVDDARWMIENMGKSPEELGLFDGAHAQSVDPADP